MITGPLSYTEFLPAADLAPWIACFWHINGAATSGETFKHRVLPDGCADVVFDLEDIRRRGGGLSTVVGPMTAASVVEFRGITDVVGVRLRPGAAAAFFGVPARALLDCCVSLSDLSELTAILPVSDARLAECAGTNACVDLLTAACRQRVGVLPTPDSIVRYALAKWSPPETLALPSVSALTRDIGLSERAFERRFVAHVGMNPVYFRRLSRFRSVLRLYSMGTRDWAYLAAAAGFSDQSHLIRDFGTFAGLTPTAWSTTQAGPAGFLQDGEITAL